jgi:two-component system KDP operon response regulator KdpE
LPRVLIIDDDRDLLNVCRVGLEALGHEVWAAGIGHDGLAEAAIRAPDVIVLDLGLPDMDGMDVCKRIRTWSDVPIVVLSADGSEDRKVDALDGGADDYMTKPFGMRELNDVGHLHLDLVHCEAALDGRVLDLTAKEFDFLAFLARHAGKVCTRRMILESVWGSQYAGDLHYLKVYAYRIRRKLGDEGGQILQSDPSVGYRLMPPGP